MTSEDGNVADSPEVTVVMPCLNEADTLEICIKKVQQASAEAGIDSAVIVADNGSTDGSVEIAERSGARVVHVERKGYGSALMGGHRGCREQGRYHGRCGRQLRLP